jgi:hypothetical protein
MRNNEEVATEYSVIEQREDHKAIPDVVGCESVVEAPFVWLKVGVIRHRGLE